LLASGELLYFTSQTSFWSVVTGPASNGMGFSVAVAVVEIKEIQRALMLLPDAPGILCGLGGTACRRGMRARGARLVAGSFGRRVLTLDTGDFGGYGVEVLEPASVAS
jgi:hypothetical protein